MGSPDFAVPCLEALLRRAEVVAVVTQPDKPAGRGQAPKAPPVKEAALRAGLPVLQPHKLRTPPFAEVLRPLALDLVVVVAYGKILPPELLAVPRLGCLNVHASLLPKYRGAAPIQHALMAGERETGVTLMRMDAGLDTGPTLAARALPITDEDTAGTLHEKLARLGAELLAEHLDAIFRGELPAVPQDDARASYAGLLDKEQGRVDWSQPAARVRDRIRGVDPWPGAFTLLEGQPLKLWRPRLAPQAGIESAAGAAPGTVLRADASGLTVACGAGAVVVAEAQLPGRKRMAVGALVAGRAIAAGTVLGR